MVYSKEQRGKYYVKNRKKIIAKSTEYYKTHKEQCNKYKREYCHRDYVALKHKIYRTLHRNAALDRYKTYYKSNRDRLIGEMKQYYYDNKERYAVNRLAYFYKTAIYIKVYYRDINGKICEGKHKGLYNAMDFVVELKKQNIRVLKMGTKKYGTLFGEKAINDMYNKICLNEKVKSIKELIDFYTTPKLRRYVYAIQSKM